MKKIFCIFLVVLFCAFTLEAQAQTAADNAYNQAVELMKKNNKSSLEKALKAFRKAQIGYNSQDNKDKCQEKIEECNKRLQSINNNKGKVKIVSNEDKTADEAFNLGEQLLKEGKLDEAKNLFERAEQLYRSSNPDKAKICKDKIDFCDCPISFDPPVIVCSANGTNEEGLEIKVTALSTEDWNILADTWLTVVKDSKKSSLKIWVEPNTTESSRTGYVTLISNQKTNMCTINQKGAVLFEPNELEFAKKPGGSQVITVKAPEDWSIGSTNEYPWIIANNLGDGRIEVKCTEMKDESERSGTIEVCCGEDKFYINVHQVSKTLLNKAKNFGKKIINKKDK